MPDSKVKHANKGDLLNLSAQAANPAVSDAIAFSPEQIGAAIYTWSDKSGNLQIQVYMGNPTAAAPEVMLDADWKDFGSARAITANTLDAYVLNQGLPPTRVKFAPGTGGNYSIVCRVWGFGG